MKKKPLLMKDLGKDHFKKHLKMFFPFLNKDFRLLKEDELNSEKTFKELFGNEPFDANKLDVIYKYQN